MSIQTHKNPLKSIPSCQHKRKQHVIQTFDSFGDVFRHIDTMSSVTGFSSAMRSAFASRDFLGGQTFDKTKDGAIFGNAAQGAAADALMRKVEALEIDVEQRQRVRSVAGGRPCVPAVVSGSMVPMRRKVAKKHSYAPLSIVVNVNSSGGINSALLEQRGIAIAALVKRIAASRPVNLYVMGGLHMRGQCTYIPMVRFPTSPVDIKRLAYVLASQGVARGLFFALSSTGNYCMERANVRYQSYIHWPFDDFAYIGDSGSTTSHGKRNIGADLAAWLKTDMLYIPGIFLDSKHVQDIKRDAVGWINDTAKQYTETKEAA